MSTPSTDRIEKRIELKAPVARVWRALTDYREFSQWFGVNLEDPFIPGNVTKGRITYPGYEHLVMEVVVQKLELPPGNMGRQPLFSFHWHPYAIDLDVDYSKEPPTLVEFRLQESPTGTLLVVTESGFDAIPVARRAEAFRMNDSGWTVQCQNIEAHIDKDPGQARWLAGRIGR